MEKEEDRKMKKNDKEVKRVKEAKRIVKRKVKFEAFCV